MSSTPETGRAPDRRDAPGALRRTVPAAPQVRPTRADVDLEAIAHNVRLVRDRVAPAEVMAVVKADGYGLGAVPIARAALRAGASWLAVALIEEGEELRSAGITAPILLLSEPPRHAAARTLAADLVPTVYTLDFSEELRFEAARRDRSIRVHVKADTGMARVGVPKWEWDRALRNLRAWPEIEVQAFWTHFACADDPGHPSVDRQLTAFREFLQLARTHGFEPVLAHAANSAAALTLDDARFDAVRLGIAMYGSPPSMALADAADLRPVVRFVTEVAYVKRVEEGTRVSYGHTWSAPADGWLATLPVGYADGMPRRLSNRDGGDAPDTRVLVAGRPHPIAGTVTMDQTLVWLGDHRVRPGEEVVLLGRDGDEEVTPTDWARKVGTIAYEILTNLGARVPRVYRGDP